MAVSHLHGIELDPRFEIRELGPQHIPWLNAILMHSYLYQNEILSDAYAGQQARMCIRCAREFGNALLPSVQTGLVFGIFDKEYQFRRPMSQRTGGALYFSEFNENDAEIEINGRQMLSEAMDFPLVSYASSYDGGDPRPGNLSLKTGLQLWPEVVDAFQAMPQDAPAATIASNSGETSSVPPMGTLMRRNGTATKDGYTGLGLMKALAHFLMFEARARGFKQVTISTINDLVFRTWARPPAPFRAEILYEIKIRECQVVKNGKRVLPYKHLNVSKGSVLIHLDGRAEF